MDTFTRNVSSIKEEIQTLEQYTNKLDQKIRTKATNVLDTQEEDHITREIKAIEEIFKELSQKIKLKLEKMHKSNESLKSRTTSSLTYETQNTHCNALTKRLALILHKYRNIQVDHHNREEHRAVSQYIIENPGVDLESAKSDLECKSRSTKGKLERSEERNKRVKELAESISELCVLINELHEMVAAQDCVVDRIEIKMEESVTSSQRAVRFLENALRYQIEATRIKRIVVVCVVGLVVVLVLYLSMKVGVSMFGK